MSEQTATPWRIGDAGTAIFGPRNGNPSPITVAPKVRRADAIAIVATMNAPSAVMIALQMAQAALNGQAQHQEAHHRVCIALAMLQ